MMAYRVSAGIPRCHIREAPGQQLIEKHDLQLRQGDARLHLCKAGSYQMTEVQEGLRNIAWSQQMSRTQPLYLCELAHRVPGTTA